MAGSDLTDVTNNAVTASRLIEQVTRQVGHRDVVEQAAIAGLLKSATLDNDEAAQYLATRLENVADELEKGWQGRVEDSNCHQRRADDDSGLVLSDSIL